MIDRHNRIVATSLEDPMGIRCVDIYQTNDGRFFWDEWRRDPEDPSGWHPTGRRDGPFDTEGDAINAAKIIIEWISN
ncbi:MAG: hypothetical protein CFH41_00851 [Alphaproteobacteria bacterium MarineAlpha11_Bin1]|nr:MAG: hypothetical protein CFH41_00851 [Alphaproteobacteria bacterium MarineAlpha11_Bin1]|tara:strand:- start:17169 stop:17399 length:231 start_codon:yes stop_codon:yes gene_type:complete